MSDKEDIRPVNIDPRSIQEALRMYFQPIKNDDPKLDFYTMYRRETMDYDTEYMQKCNEDLNTTLIFAGLFSAVSSAFVLDTQSGLQPDSGERSEAYLRAILLSLNPSISPGEDPAAPPTWNRPPAEIVVASGLLYSSLLISLFAAFVAMLGKQWLNRYLRHSGGSVIERCGDRQRKCDGLEKWPFHLFVESLPIMLQVSLFLLACGLSRYMWSVNTSVARVVVSFTVVGILFYIGIVVAGISSYECPLQTPVSMALRHLRDDRTSLLRVVSVIRATQKSAREFLKKLGNVGHRAGTVLPIATDANREPPVPLNESGPLTTMQNLATLRRQNSDSARCICWILRKITDPEAIDSAICLAGTVRWFDDDSDQDPPYDSIVSTFEACFDSTYQLHPGMRNRAYYSARAILKINAGARARSNECASKYPISGVPSSSSTHADPDLHHILNMLKYNIDAPQPIIDFPTAGENTDAHLLWVSNLLVELTHAGPELVFESFVSCLKVAVAGHRVAIYNILLFWYMHFGGEVKEETWVTGKSASFESILSNLSTRVLRVVASGDRICHLHFLLEFLSTWENRPNCLTQMAYQWCRAISGVVGRYPPGGMSIILPASLARLVERRLRLQLRDLDADDYGGSLCRVSAREFGKIGTDRGPTESDSTRGQALPAFQFYTYFLPIILEVGFRLVGTEPEWGCISVDDSPHHGWAFEIAFTSNDDEAIADAVCMFVMIGIPEELDSFARYFGRRMETDAPFFPRLQRLIIHAIRCIWESGLKELGSETVRLLNRLDVVEVEIWDEMLEDVIHCSAGLEGLSLRYWQLMLEGVNDGWRLEPRDIDVIGLLRKAEDWEKLEVWMLTVWICLPNSDETIYKSVDKIQEVTFEVLSQRPSALRRFELLYKPGAADNSYDRMCREGLQEVLDRARAEILSLAKPQTPLQLAFLQPSTPLLFAGDDSF